MGLFLLLSVPVFYIIGLVATIRWVFGYSKKSGVDRKTYLEKVVSELSEIVAKTPNKTLTKQLEEYRRELNTLKNAEKIALTVSSLSPEATEKAGSSTEKGRILSQVPISKEPAEKGEDLSKLWTNWYSDNSINLLLYLGAFLIVASAMIYVGFQWQTLGGTMKAVLLTLLTLTFFGFGAWFYNVPKIKNAGATFIAIAAILIPFNGLAWYNFVLGSQGYTIGSVWLVTSIFAVIAYAVLAYFIRHPFYTYIAGFGGLSLVLSTVNVAQMNREYYILGGIFSSFVLLLSTRIFTKPNKEQSNDFITPLSISAHIIMPVSLIFGLSLAISSGKLYSFEVVTSAFLATLYYLIAYSFAREMNYLLISLFLLPLSLFLTGKYLYIGTSPILIFIQILTIVYLSVSYFLAKYLKKEAEYISLAAHFLMPVSAISTALLVAFSGSIYTAELVLAGFFATAFYFLAYFVNKDNSFAVLAEIILPLTVFVGARWLNFSTLSSFYVLEVVLTCYLIIAFTVRRIRKVETQTLTITALTFAASLFLLSLVNGFSPFHQTIFAAIPAIFGLSAIYISGKYEYLYYNFAFINIAVYLYFNELLGLSDKMYIVGLAYMSLAIIFYFISTITKGRKGAFEAFIQVTIFNALLGSVLTSYKPEYFLIANLIAAFLALDASFRYKQHGLIYVSNLMFYFALWSILRVFDARTIYYPLFFTGLSYALYAVSAILPENINAFYRYSGLIGIGVNTLIFGILGQDNQRSYYDFHSGSMHYIKETLLERSALISSYAATFLYSLDAMRIKKAAFGYFASAVAILTYLWQMKYLGFTETQTYTLPLGLYFMVLAYLQKKSGKREISSLLDYTGLFILFIPTLFQSFGPLGAKYALLLGIEGVIVFALGNTLSYRIYVYAGIAATVTAVISQTYEFLFSLPRWLITAAAGLLFLSTAIYLLLHRKEEPRE
jgi:hypothetical protein